jgi:hypothetical protein
MARVSEHEIREGKAIVEDMVCAFCEARGMVYHDLEWGPEDQDLQFPLRVIVGGRSSARVLKIPRAPLEDREVGTLVRLARNFVWAIPPDVV